MFNPILTKLNQILIALAFITVQKISSVFSLNQRFPIYTQRAMEIYIGKRRNEVPPHIFAIAEGAFQGMMTGGKNQSILIT